MLTRALRRALKRGSLSRKALSLLLDCWQARLVPAPRPEPSDTHLLTAFMVMPTMPAHTRLDKDSVEAQVTFLVGENSSLIIRRSVVKELTTSECLLSIIAHLYYRIKY